MAVGGILPVKFGREPIRGSKFRKITKYENLGCFDRYKDRGILAKNRA